VDPFGPKLNVFPDPVDFGSVPIDDTSSREIQVRNLGEADGGDLSISEFVIQDAESETGLFAFGGAVEIETLTPGEVVTISIDFTRKAEGAAEAVLRIQSNSVLGDTTLVRLYSDDHGRVNLNLDPETVDFGRVPRGQQKNMNLTIQNALLGDDVADLVISRLEITAGAGSFFLAEGGPLLPKHLAAGISAVVPITAYPENPGQIDGNLAVYHNDPSKDYPLMVPLRMIGVVPELEVNPAIVAFGPVPIGENRQVILSLLNQGGDTLEVTSASFSALSNSFFGIELDPDENGIGELPDIIGVGGMATLAVVYNPQSFGEHEGVLFIKSNDYAGQDIQVAVTGQGIPPNLTITPAELDFGCVQAGRMAELPVTVKYSGDGELTVSAVYVQTSQVFGVPNAPTLPVTLNDESDPLQIPVAYQPYASSPADSDELVIVIGDEDPLDFRVPLKGCGIASSIRMAFDDDSQLLDVQIVPPELPAIDEMSPTEFDLWVARAPVTVFNDGQATLTLSLVFPVDVQPSDPDPAVWAVDVDLPLLVPPGEQASFDVLFAPRQKTNYVMRATVCSDALDATGTDEGCEELGHRTQFQEIRRTPIELDLFVEPISGIIEFPLPAEPAPDGFVTDIIRLQNNGSDSMHIDSIELVGSEAALQAFFIDGIEPPAGEDGWVLTNSVTDSIVVSLRFQPQAEGSISAALAILHNDKDAAHSGEAAGSAYPEYSVVLSGNGAGNTPPRAVVKSPQGFPDDPHSGVINRAVEINEDVFLDGSFSYDDDESDFVTAWTWSIEEEEGFSWLALQNTQTSLIKFTQSGTFHVNLQVLDSHGAYSVPTRDSRLAVKVQIDPVADAQVNGSESDSLETSVGVPMLLDGTASTDEDGEIRGWRWYWREHPDGDLQFLSGESQLSHDFQQAGYFDILLEVVDDDGRVSEEMDEIVVHVLDNDSIRIEAVWTNGGNVDLHYIKPNGGFGTEGDCNTENREPDWDDFGNPEFRQASDDGNTPEVVVHEDPADGVYTVRAQYVEATESCGYEEGECEWYSENCDVCGCSCPDWLCWADPLCCNSCWDCSQEWVCQDQAAGVTFNLYLNGSSTITWVVEGTAYLIDESPGFASFSLHREDGHFIQP